MTGHKDEVLKDLDAKGKRIYEIGKTVYSVIQQAQSKQDSVVESLLMGNYAPALAIGQTLIELLQMAGEFIETAANNYLDLVGSNPYGAGKQFGYVIFQIAQFFIPGDGLFQAGEALSNLSKARFLRVIADKLGRIPSLTAPILRAVQELKPLAAACEGTNMCFIAGTPVMTAHGLQPIECIRQGDWVLSRDPATGHQGYRSVLATVVTHPSVLYHIHYRTRGSYGRASHTQRSQRRSARACRAANASEDSGSDDEEDSTLVCTGVHPFYVVNQERFVQAAELVPGDRLSLASGAEAIVTSRDLEEAAPGNVYTT